MDIKQLRSFLLIAESGSVTKAAESQHVVQPAISRQLRLLEESIGLALFTRKRQGMELTDAGNLLIEYAKRAIRELDLAQEELQAARGHLSGNVTLGLLPSTCDLLASPLLKGLRFKHPHVRVRITVGYAGHLQQWLENGEIDVALLYDPTSFARLKIQPLLEEKLFLVGLPGSGLRTDRPVTIAELAAKPLVLPSAPHGIRKLVEQRFAASGMSLSVAAETNAMSVQKSLVLDGFGFTILPSCAISDDLKRGTLAAAPIEKPDLCRRITLALPANGRSSSAVRHVVTELLWQMKTKVRSGQWPEAIWLHDANA